MGYLFALTATLFWSGNAVIARFIADTVPPVGVSFWRWFVALLVCIPFTYPAFRRNLPEVRKHWKYLTITAFLGVALFNTLLYTAAHTTTAFNIAVISTLTPVIILSFSVLFTGERLRGLGLFGFFLSAAGILSLVTDGHPVRIFDMKVANGDFIMLFAAGVFALYTVLIRRKPRSVDMNALIFFIFTAGLFMLFPVYLIEEIYYKPVLFGRDEILCFIYIGIFASFVSFMLWNRAVVLIGAARSGAVYYSIPVFTGIFGYLFIGEALTAADIVSMLVVALGVYLTGKK